MKNHTIEVLESYYHDRLGKGGISSLQLGWENREAHYARFATLAESVQLVDRSILDVGCGLGDLCEFLDEEGIACNYLGVDLLEEMINRARHRFPSRRFRVLDLISDPASAGETFDVVYSSGVFNLRASANQSFLSKAFDSFVALSNHHIVVSLLDERSPDRDDTLYCYHNQEQVTALLQRPGWTIAVVSDYLPNDFTIIASKED